jgi:hypothetical protein
MSLSIRFLPETCRSLAFGSVGASYIGIGTSFTRPIRMLMVQNLTDVSLWFSFDGINDHFPLPTDGYLMLDITANKISSQGFFIAEGQRLYVKDLGIPSSGSVYVTTFYGADL